MVDSSSNQTHFEAHTVLQIPVIKETYTKMVNTLELNCLRNSCVRKL